MIYASSPPRSPVAAGSTSPDGAYELKYLLPEERVAPLVAWARAHLEPDPHAETPGEDTYHIHSLYFDTPALDVYHSRPGFQETKYRVRRYGREALLYLERKTKSERRVRKRRTPLPEAELPLLASAETPHGWSGDWFHRRLREHALAPRCEVAYRRLARQGVTDGQPVRLTLDRDLRCAPASGLRLGDPRVGDWRPLGRTVLELKFRDTLPRLFEELVCDLHLEPASSSKYRHSVEVCGLAGGS
jgi:hypothetical protein